MLLALSFVPTEQVADYFDQLAYEMPDDARPVVDYSEDTYVGLVRGNRRREGRFPVEMWNNYRRTRLDLPNAVEAWHVVFTREFPATIPVWRLISHLKTEEAVFEGKVEQLMSRAPVNKKKYVDLDSRIKAFVNSFAETEPMEFLMGLAHNLSCN